MSDLQELYQEIVMEHNWKPRNFRLMDDADQSANGVNPFCGDQINIYLKIDDGVVTDVSFQGSGCAISRASASMMTESIKGKTLEEVQGTFERFHSMITGEGEPDALGDLAVLAGVSEYPTRIKCAILSWHTLRAGIDGDKETVRTE